LTLAAATPIPFEGLYDGGLNVAKVLPAASYTLTNASSLLRCQFMTPKK
jgi:hypothetical protein